MGPSTHPSRERSRWANLAASEPGATTVAALDEAEPSGMAGADLVDAIVACERAISHLHATRAALTAAFAQPGVAGDLTGLITTLTGKRGAARAPDGTIDPDLLAAYQQDYAQSLAAAEIAAALHIPHRTASARVAAARELVDELPATWQALRAGRIDQRRTDVIAAATRCLAGDVRAAAEAAVAPLAQDRIPRQVQELLDRAVIAADPDAATVRERQARGDRTVRHYSERDGVGKIHATLTAEGAAAVFTLLDLLAQATNGTTEPDGRRRGIDARRADALTDIATELLTTGQIDLTGYGRVPDDTGQRGNDDCDGDTENTGTDGDPEPNSANANTGPEHTDRTDADTDTRTDADPGRTDTDPSTASTNSDPKPGADANPGRTDTDPSTASTNSDPKTGADANPDNTSTDADPHLGTNTHTDPNPAAQHDVGSRPAWQGLSRHGRRPHLIVTVGMSTLAGMDRLPGHLAGHGAVTAELALTIADAYQTLALVGVDPRTGTAAAVSSTVYRPRQALADQIASLAPHCRFPGCRQPAWRSDHDHRVPFNHLDPESGGLTSLWDCDPECRRHHVFKTHAQWSADGRPDRTIVWTSPTGHHYITSPAEYRIPGEGTDPDWSELILPATWPQPPPAPPGDASPAGDEVPQGDPLASGPGRSGAGGPDGDGLDPDTADPQPPSPEMLVYLAAIRQRDRQMARFRSIAFRARSLLRAHGRPADSAGRHPEPTGPGAARPLPSGSGRPSGFLYGPQPDAQPGPQSDPDGPAWRRRHRSNRDCADQAAIERAIRIASGLPDPNDEPPPF